jgi:NADPH:quinone reductase-like Zn-dependent oxidoreductase
MKAAVYTRYGSADVLQITDADTPVPRDHEVLLRIRAASVNPLDEGLLKGAGRIVTGLRTPRIPRLGFDVAGHVEMVGSLVTQFAPGDEVFGVCIGDPHDSAIRVWIPQGAFAEYGCAHEAALVKKPRHVTFDQAAAAPVAAFTALQALRDKGRLRPGQKVLINGAAGGVGTFAVQIAKSLDGDVTGVCSARNAEMVRSIGADHVIDYTQEDFTRGDRRYELILDCVGNHSLSACRQVLHPQGTCVMVGDRAGRGVAGMIARLIEATVVTRLTRQKLVTFLARPNPADLITIRDLMAAGRLTPVIDRRYPLSELPDAIRYLGQGHARGKVVVTLDGD